MGLFYIQSGVFVVTFTDGHAQPDENGKEN